MRPLTSTLKCAYAFAITVGFKSKYDKRGHFETRLREYGSIILHQGECEDRVQIHESLLKWYALVTMHQATYITLRHSNTRVSVFLYSVASDIVKQKSRVVKLVREIWQHYSSKMSK